MRQALLRVVLTLGALVALVVGGLVVPSVASAADTIPANSSLPSGQSLTSQNGSYSLQVQPDGNAVVVTFTVYGDANLDHTVDLTDFTFLAANFNQTGTAWTRGDVNYDAKTDLTDFTYLASNFNQTLPGAPVQAQSQGVAAQSLFSAVPVTE